MKKITESELLELDFEKVHDNDGDKPYFYFTRKISQLVLITNETSDQTTDSVGYTVSPFEDESIVIDNHRSLSEFIWVYLKNSKN